MEILTYYIIAALSFSLMYTINYGWEVAQTVMEMLYMFDIDYMEAPDWSPGSYVVSVFVMAFIFMPIFVPNIFQDKHNKIRDAASFILEKHYGFVKEDDNQL